MLMPMSGLPPYNRSSGCVSFWTLQQVKELLGHSTIQITERHYAYLAPRNLQDAISKLESSCIETSNENDRKAY